MVRTQVQLNEDQWRSLKKLAAARGVSVAEMVRQGVAILVRNSIEVDREERWRRALSLVGRFHSGKKDLARKHDNYLAEAFDP